MGEAGGGVGGGVPSPFVGVAVEPPQPVAQILAAGHQVGAIQPEASPVLKNPQSLPGPIEIGIEQALDGLRLKRSAWACPITAGNRGGNGGRRRNRHAGCGEGGWSVP